MVSFVKGLYTVGQEDEFQGSRAEVGMGEGEVHGRLPGQVEPHLPQRGVVRARWRSGRVEVGGLGSRKVMAKPLGCGCCRCTEVGEVDP